MVNNAYTFSYHAPAANRLWSTIPSCPVPGITIYTIKLFQGIGRNQPTLKKHEDALAMSVVCQGDTQIS